MLRACLSSHSTASRLSRNHGLRWPTTSVRAVVEVMQCRRVLRDILQQRFSCRKNSGSMGLARWHRAAQGQALHCASESSVLPRAGYAVSKDTS